MKHTLENRVAALLLATPMSMALASGGHASYEEVDIDLHDQVSLQYDAQIFANYCLPCHSAGGIRFNRLRDIGLAEDEIKKNLVFITDKVGDAMLSAMNPKDAARWFDTEPPDSTLITRSRGTDYLYAYMRGFYKDPTHPNGRNNTVLDKAGMSYPLREQQRIHAVELGTKGQPVMVKDEHGNLTPKPYWESTGLHNRRLPNGKVAEEEYDDYMRSLVNFLVYTGEPAQLGRKRIGYMVVIFLSAVMLPLAYFPEKGCRKDVH